jgi:hypothetical protein
VHAIALTVEARGMNGPPHVPQRVDAAEAAAAVSARDARTGALRSASGAARGTRAPARSGDCAVARAERGINATPLAADTAVAHTVRKAEKPAADVSPYFAFSASFEMA